MVDLEENLSDTGQILYDWNPPTGVLQNYYYNGSRITSSEVDVFNTCLLIYVCLLERRLDADHVLQA